MENHDDPAVRRYWEFLDDARWESSPSPEMLRRKPLGRNEVFGFSHPDSYKRSALITDRIYLPYWVQDQLSSSVPLELTFGHHQIDEQTANWYMTSYECNMVPMQYRGQGDRSRKYLYDMHVLGPMKQYAEIYPHTTIVPLDFDLDEVFAAAGQDLAYEAVLSRVPIVIEEGLTWDQVLEFRRDKESVRKYRDLHLWIQTALSSTTPQAIDDLVGQKLDDYTWAIRKHGLSTRLSAVTSLITAAGAGIPIGGIIAHLTHIDPVLGSASGVALSLLSGAAWVAQRKLELYDTQRGAGRELAYVYDINRLAE